MSWNGKKTAESYYNDYNATDDFTDFELFKWTLNTNASWLKLNITSGELNGTPAKADVGSFWVNISVEDDEGERTYRYFIINVSKSPNIIPKFSGFRMLPRDADTEIEYKFSVFYSDGDSEPPTKIQVIIDEVTLDLELREGEIPYKGRYEVATILTEGEHSYYFVASDGIDTITSDTFQTPYIKNAKTDEPTEDNWTWLYLLLLIVIIIIILLFLILFKRKKKQKSKEEAILSKQPPIKKTTLPPIQPDQLSPKTAPTPQTYYYSQQNITSIPQVTPSIDTYDQQPLSKSSHPTPKLPPADEDKVSPEIVEDLNTTLEDNQDVMNETRDTRIQDSSEKPTEALKESTETQES